MMEKWKQRAIQMNFKKAVIVFLIACFVLAVSVPVALYVNFQDRISAWEQVRETDREERDFREEEKRSGENGRDSWESEERSGKNGRDSWEGEKSSGENDGDYREDDESGPGDREQGRDSKERDSKERDEKDLEEIHRNFHLSWGDLALLAGCAAAGTVLGIWYWILVMLWTYRKAYRMSVNGMLAVLAALFFNLAAVAALYLYGMLKGTCANCGRVRSGKEKFCGRCGSPFKTECPQCGQEVDASAAYCSNCGKRMNRVDGDEETEGSGKE